MASGHDITQLNYREISQCRREEACEILARLNRIERKTFPASEAFAFAPELLKKANTFVGFLVYEGHPDSTIVAYCVVVRVKSIALLHKICVIESWRGLGAGKLLMSCIRERHAKTGCRSIQLWVDEEREAARRLYKSNGFKEVDLVEAYYGPGRTGIKMTLEIRSV
jgi:ribosomal protein S18 acetylase RimI-like enzyme